MRTRSVYWTWLTVDSHVTRRFPSVILIIDRASESLEFHFEAGSAGSIDVRPKPGAMVAPGHSILSSSGDLFSAVPVCEICFHDAHTAVEGDFDTFLVEGFLD
jgi:hypothetical protein